MSEEKTIQLIDLSSIYWMHWHATADLEISEASARTVRHVRELADGPERVAVCCDAPPYKRREILPEYKANRVAAPAVAIAQFERTKERLRADGFLLWASPGFEADDVIAFGCAQALDAGLSVRVVSSDKDLLQLVSETCTVFSPASKTLMSAEDVMAKFGVFPATLGDFLALVGDKSDNVPGVPGVGPVTATALLRAFGSLEKILTAAADPDDARFSKPKIREALIAHAQDARLSRRVIELCTDVPIDWQEIFAPRVAVPLVEADVSKMDGEDMPEKQETNQGPVDNVLPAQPDARNSSLVSPIVMAPRAEEWSLALEPRSSKGAWEAAGLLFNSRLYTQLQSQEAIYAVLLRGRALGMDATTALAAFHNIRGRLTMHADLIAALVLRSGKAEYFEASKCDFASATYATKRVGGRAEQVATFSIQDAFFAGLVVKSADGRDGYIGISESGRSSNWDKYRDTMLQHRAKTKLARSVYPDVVLGLYSPDEIDESLNAGVVS